MRLLPVPSGQPEIYPRNSAPPCWNKPRVPASTHPWPAADSGRPVPNRTPPRRPKPSRKPQRRRCRNNYSKPCCKRHQNKTNRHEEKNNLTEHNYDTEPAGLALMLRMTAAPDATPAPGAEHQSATDCRRLRRHAHHRHSHASRSNSTRRRRRLAGDARTRTTQPGPHAVPLPGPSEDARPGTAPDGRHGIRKTDPVAQTLLRAIGHRVYRRPQHKHARRNATPRTNELPTGPANRTAPNGAGSKPASFSAAYSCPRQHWTASQTATWKSGTTKSGSAPVANPNRPSAREPNSAVRPAATWAGPTTENPEPETPAGLIRHLWAGRRSHPAGKPGNPVRHSRPGTDGIAPARTGHCRERKPGQQPDRRRRRHPCGSNYPGIRLLPADRNIAGAGHIGNAGAGRPGQADPDRNRTCRKTLLPGFALHPRRPGNHADAP